LGKGIDMSDRRELAFFDLNLEIEFSMRRKIVRFLLREYFSEVMIFGGQTR
jgi:hypothetical protein